MVLLGIRDLCGGHLNRLLAVKLLLWVLLAPFYAKANFNWQALPFFEEVGSFDPRYKNPCFYNDHRQLRCLPGVSMLGACLGVVKVCL